AARSTSVRDPQRGNLPQLPDLIGREVEAVVPRSDITKPVVELSADDCPDVGRGTGALQATQDGARLRLVLVGIGLDVNPDRIVTKQNFGDLAVQL
ncbi:MAG TPA: hypothetical protein VMZ33_07080, partial [Candidatus Limnocylindrales bacterium]|nr:hypothetical protein [Candidatus Limnocylindrales bacterium]